MINPRERPRLQAETISALPRGAMYLWSELTLRVEITRYMTCRGRSISSPLRIDTMRRTPSSRQKRAIIKIGYYTYEPKYTDAGV
jgi:hypothetical protein